MTWVNPKETEIIIKNIVNSIVGDLELFDNEEYEHFDFNRQYKKQLIEFFTKISEEYSLFSTGFDFSNKKNIVNDKEKIKKAAMFIDSFLVRTNTNLKKCASSKDLPEKESVIEILESQKRVLEKIKEILTS